MKIVVIGHALIVEENRKRWISLAAKDPQLQVRLWVPSYWEQNWFGKLQKWETTMQKVGNYEVLPVDVTHHSQWGKYRIKNLRKLLREENPDFIFVMQEEFTLCLLSVILHKKLFVPKAKLFFFSWQNLEIVLKKIHKKIFWKLVCNLTDGLLAGTEQIRQVFLSAGYYRPIFVQTEIGVDPKLFYPDLHKRIKMREVLGIGEEEFVFGFAGRIVYEKGVEDLAQALLGLSLEKKWKWLMVGDGILRDKIKGLFAEAGISERLLMIGEIPVQQTPDYYRCMDCLVLPSRTTPLWKEQFGLVLAQAMMIGLTVIGSNSGAIPEVIGDDRFIFSEGDQESLRALLCRVMEREKGGDRGRELLQRGEIYSVDSLANATYEILQGKRL